MHTTSGLHRCLALRALLLVAVVLLPVGCAGLTISETVQPSRPHAEEEPVSEAPAVLDLPDPKTERIRERELYIESILTEMELRAKLGQLLMIGMPFDPYARPLHQVDTRLRTLVEAVQPGGFLVFGHNLATPEQAREFVAELQSLSTHPMIIGIDHEGGTVSRLTEGGRLGATVVPPAALVGATGNPEYAYRIGGLLARELGAVGISMNMAPVADVYTNSANSVIGNRSFGSDPELVSAMVAAMVRGLQDEQVSAVLKHFPGHGDTYEDTHYERAVIAHGRSRLEQVEFLPFRAGIAAGADAVMTAHIGVPEITGDATPASFSYVLITEILRGELGFDGVVITDSLTMGALRGNSEAEMVVSAIEAGADIALLPSGPVQALNALVRAVESGRLSEERVDDSVRRVLRLKYDRGLLGGEAAAGVLGAPEHGLLVEEVLRAAR